ncbi:putative oxalocrotonate tautomerase [Paraphoma chrysanthemicola]|uniref:Oxalocrotonate tautomerase n=1 Tax=Paraphoma chrysanthemicola TaxID=798071 RepID=A0A8K0R418_9PLEO|nr:putative oxalocrotonate tautomerase [Paraphoma chrysanthemicola]
MPFWTIYHPPSAFTDQAEKQEIAEKVVSIYRRVPRHYISVLFIPVEPTSYFCGAAPRPGPRNAKYDPQPNPEVPYIRITMQHIARTFVSASVRDEWLAKVDAALKPHIADKGWDWEYSVEETRRDMWKVNGLIPPMPNSKTEKEWVETNIPKPYTLEDAGLTDPQPIGFTAQI